MISLSVAVGIVVGFIGTVFHILLDAVTELRLEHPALLLLLPVGAIGITALYRFAQSEEGVNTNLVLSAIHSDDALPLKMAPLIFTSTIATHLCGGSAGREGAALQLGGSIGNAMGTLFSFDETEKKTLIMCGMSAAFSALFGTPMAAAVFSLEVVSVGIMHYAALLPCVISSLIARGIAASFHTKATAYTILEVPSFSPVSAAKIIGLAVGCGLVSIAFCLLLHRTQELYSRIFKHPYLKAFVGGCILLFLTALCGKQTYNGAGGDIIALAMEGQVHWEYFILKMIFTACTLACGYKGGEIVPTLFVGSTFGCLYGQIAGLSPSLCAAVGMGSLFCGVTNCPITALLICLEMFGTDALPFFLLSVSFSYLISGYSGLYSSQKIVYSKYHSHYINRQVK